MGETESGLAERLAGRIEALDEDGSATLAFLASGIEGIKVRVTAKGVDRAAAQRAVDAVADDLRSELGVLVFGEDDQTMESAVADRLHAAGLTFAVAESMTGGMVAARFTDVPGVSAVFRGGIVSYASDVKWSLLDVPEGPVVNAATAEAMATGVCRLLGADVGLSITGVAGPSPQDGETPGTVFVGIAIDGGVASHRLSLFGDRKRIRSYATIRSYLASRPALTSNTGAGLLSSADRSDGKVR